MTDPIQVLVPDIGDAAGVTVAELLVAKGDAVTEDQSLLVLESDKASMEVPSPTAGTIAEILVSAGDEVAQGAAIVSLVPSAATAPSTPAAEPKSSGQEASPADRSADKEPQSAPVRESAPPAVTLPDADLSADLVVIGSGPGGYTAAFRAADLGLDVVLVEKDGTLGGVCLNVGCIPSKAMLHAAAVIDQVQEFADRGIRFGDPEIDLDRLNAWKDGVVGTLTGGLMQLAKRRKVRVVQATATFTGANVLQLEGAEDIQTLAFRHAIIAVGSRPVMIPGLPDDDRIWTSDEAIRVTHIPKRLLVVGGGIIGLEMAQVYSALGSTISVVELADGLMPGTDRDLVKVLHKRLASRYENIWTGIKVAGIKALKKGLKVTFQGDGAPAEETFDAVLIAVGRRPNGDRLGAADAGIMVDDRGFIAVDNQQRTNTPHIFAIGDVAGNPMLAHKATHEGKVAAEVAAGKPSAFDAQCIPSVAYTDPEIAWVGLTETEARERGIEIDRASIPWAASGRALGIGRTDGATKLLSDKATGRILGAGIVGPHAGDLISEVALAIEMSADVEDLALTIHPHPTLSETVAFAAEAIEGTITDLYLPKRR